MQQPGSRHIIIVGGGASGTLLAAHLLRCPAQNFRVSLIESRATVGAGLAYSTAHPGHLLNVRAANMSAFADQPHHFIDWLQQTGGDRSASPFAFAERRIYGAYLASLVKPHITSQLRAGRLVVVHGRAVSIETSDTATRVALADGTSISGDAIVLATGNEARSQNIPGSPAVYESPWERPRDTGIPEGAPVLILGTGLTMIDYVIWLQAHGHQGPIYALSRRGLLPQVHRVVEPLQLTEQDVPFGAGLVAHMRWLRVRVARQMQAGGDWRAVIDAVRPYTWKIWQELPQTERSRFLRHAKSWWEIHRHRMAPQVDRRIRHLILIGQLQVIAGKLTHVEKANDRLLCTFRLRGSAIRSTLRVTNIVDCAGVTSDPECSRNPLMAQILQAELARPDPQHLGLETTRDWAVLDKRGIPSTRLFAIGPLTRGTAWETIAVPDIRRQCAELVDVLTRPVAANQPA